MFNVCVCCGWLLQNASWGVLLMQHQVKAENKREKLKESLQRDEQRECTFKPDTAATKHYKVGPFHTHTYTLTQGDAGLSMSC